MKSKLLCVLGVLCGLFPYYVNGQNWEKKPIDYTDTIRTQVKYYELKGDIPEVAMKLLVNGYRLFISEPDGENCPFKPSCSRFLIEALKRTNLFEAILLASDRLIRDTSFSDKYKHYPSDKHGYLIDPPNRYINRH
jgi:putative component of membrane protein insertase Oxa1/YidC/SpoIIIJ protein YidD